MAFGIDFTKTLFFDNTGFLAIGTSGNSSNQGSAVIHLTSCNFSFTNNTTDLQSFDSTFSIARAITSTSFSVETSGYFTSSNENGYSGETTYINNQHNAVDVLLLAISKRTDLKFVYKSGGKVLKGNVIISDYNIESSVGEAQTYSFTLQSNGPLTVVA